MIYEKNGTLILSDHDFDHIQGHIDEEGMTLQEAVEDEVEMLGLTMKDIYVIQTSMGISKEHLDLYCKIACEVKTGRRE